MLRRLLPIWNERNMGSLFRGATPHLEEHNMGRGTCSGELPHLEEHKIESHAVGNNLARHSEIALLGSLGLAWARSDEVPCWRMDAATAFPRMEEYNFSIHPIGWQGLDFRAACSG